MNALAAKVVGATIGTAIFLGLGLAMAHAQVICG